MSAPPPAIFFLHFYVVFQCLELSQKVSLYIPRPCSFLSIYDLSIHTYHTYTFLYLCLLQWPKPPCLWRSSSYFRIFRYLQLRLASLITNCGRAKTHSSTTILNSRFTFRHKFSTQVFVKDWRPPGPYSILHAFLFFYINIHLHIHSYR